MGMFRKHRLVWSKQDDMELAQLVSEGLTVCEIAEEMGRTAKSIKIRAARINVQLNEKPRLWSAEETELLRAMVLAGTPRSQMCESLGRNFDSVRMKIERLKEEKLL